LNELELAYLSASDAHQIALRAWEGQDRRLNRILADLDSARASGDQDRVNRAYAAIQTQAGELSRMDREVARTAEALAEAREPYLAALSDRVEELISELGETRDPAERRDLAAVLEATNNRYEVILQESLVEPEIELQVLQEITIQTSDTPAEIRSKAGFLDYRADQYEAERVLTEQRLEQLRAQQRRARAVRDFITDALRYDDTRPPVVPSGSSATNPPDPGQVLPDTLGVEERPLSLEERIAGLQLLSDRLADYIVRVRDRADLFRRMAGGEWA
jgi:hypothetical protein